MQLDRSRKDLETLLSQVDDLDCLRMIWAMNALQTGRHRSLGRLLFDYPPDAITADPTSKLAIHPWELETLANELLATPKMHFTMIDCRRWNVAAHIINQLRELDDGEARLRCKETNFLLEFGRIAARQFPWQRGYTTLPSLYRSAFIFGDEICKAHFAQKHGFTSSDFTLVGFALRAIFQERSEVRPADVLRALEKWVSEPDILQRALHLLARPLQELRRHAELLPRGEIATAYTPSILRQFPCIRAGNRGRTLLAPLPDLIMDRITNGLLYDVIDGNGTVRRAIGKRFEEYSLALLTRMLGCSFEKEQIYETPLGSVATPDILMRGKGKSVELAIECKAAKMNFEAKFGQNYLTNRGYDEIAKGIMQLWRFFAHCRTGICSQDLMPDARGMILTLDEWFAGRPTVVPRIMAQAHELANDSKHGIQAQDRREIAFCTISELEEVLVTATKESLLEAVRIGSGERAGWMLPILHQEVNAAKFQQRDYPFMDEIDELLPWRARLRELARNRGAH